MTAAALPRQRGLQDGQPLLEHRLGHRQWEEEADDVGVDAARQQHQPLLQGPGLHHLGELRVRRMAARLAELHRQHGPQPPHFRHLGHLRLQPLQLDAQDVPQFVGPFHQAFVLDDVQHRVRRRDRQGVARVGASEPTWLRCIHHLRPARHRRQGEPSRQGFGRHDQVRMHIVVVHREPLPRAREAGLHLIGNEQDAVLVAQLSQAPHQLGGRHVEAALSLHRLDEDGRHPLGLDVRLEEVLKRPERVLHADAVQGDRKGHMVDLRRKRPEACLVRHHLSGERQAHHRPAVEPPAEGDDAAAARGRTGDLHRVLDGLGPRGEEGRLLGERPRRQPVEPLGQPHVGLVGDDLVGAVREGIELGLHRLDHPRVAMPRVEHRDAAREVDEAAALHVPQLTVLRAGDEKRRHHPHPSRCGGILAAQQVDVVVTHLAPPCGSSPKPSVLHHHVADGRVVLQRIHGQVLAVTGALHAPMRHLAHQHEVGVDPRATVLEFGGHLHGLADVLAPHRAGQAVVRVVRPRNGLGRVLEARHRHHRTKHLPADDLILLLRPRHHRGRVEEAAATARLAPRGDLDVLLPRGALHEARHALALLLGDERPHLHPLPVRAAHLNGGDRARQVRHEPVIHLGPRVDAARGGAVLPRVVEAEGAHPGHHACQVRVVEDDDGGLAAQLQVGALDALRGGLEHLLARGHVPGERNHAHLRLADERRPHRLPASRHHVDDAGRKQARDELGQLQQRQRCLLRGLDDHRVARGHRGAQLPCRHHQRVVPRGDGGHHAHRIPANHAGVARGVLPRGQARHAARRAREEAEHVGHRRNLIVEGRGVRLAAVARLQPGEVRSLGLDGIGELEQQRGAILRGRARPGGEGLLRRLHRRLNLRRRGLRHAGDHLAGGRGEDVLHRALARHELPVDELLAIELLAIHGGSPECHERGHVGPLGLKSLAAAGHLLGAPGEAPGEQEGNGRHEHHDHRHHVRHRHIPGTPKLVEQPDGQRALVTRGEGGDDDFIEAQGEGEDAAREQRGGHLRQQHIAERLQAVRPQVHGGLDERVRHAPQPGDDVVVDHHQAERAVPSRDGPEAQGRPRQPERRQQGDAGDDARQRDGQREHQRERLAAEELPAGEHQRRQRAQHQSQHGGRRRHPERQEDGRQHVLPLQRDPEPAQGKALERKAEGALLRVEGVEAHHDDGEVQEYQPAPGQHRQPPGGARRAGSRVLRAHQRPPSAGPRSGRWR
ncbi:hypothetical protein STIAU_4929 [Stigmatella aurantiaca DW4/3-1]|uniref:Uncharacterized protein n=1 Tax=Stigmatella aurantiaca (strain DW4/3-1) TaxID=378806 RepID=Q094Z8_STIAD|nr:hypothetical protein STIAU_4929 [Stigmatella aurantiaca DW4/3-1]